MHTFSSESRDLLQSYTAPDIGLASHSTSYGYSLDKELELVTRPDALTVDPSYDLPASSPRCSRKGAALASFSRHLASGFSSQ